MFCWSGVKNIWKWLQQFPPHNGRKKLLAWLCQEYVEETRHSIQFQGHAERMHYPQFRKKLSEIAEEERKHAQWLEAKIIAFGGQVPQISPTPEEGFNSWERLCLDLEEEKRCISELAERLAIAAEIDPETAGVLRRLLDEEKNHREVIRDMLMRSDPQAVWPI